MNSDTAEITANNLLKIAIENMTIVPGPTIKIGGDDLMTRIRNTKNLIINQVLHSTPIDVMKMMTMTTLILEIVRNQYHPSLIMFIELRKKKDFCLRIEKQLMMAAIHDLEFHILLMRY